MKKKYWIAAALVVALIAVALGVTFVLNGRNDESPQQEASRDLVGNAVVGEGVVSLDDDSLSTVKSMGDVNRSAYVLNMLDTTWHFKDGSSPSYDVSVVNDPANENPVYLELVLGDGTEKVLFVSDYLEPGDAIHGIELGEQLAKGEYSCTLVYHMMDQEKKEEVDTVKLAITVVVEN